MTIDAASPYLIAVVGHPEATKTTMIVALIDSMEREGAGGLDVNAFAPAEETIRYIRGLGPDDPLAAYRAGGDVKGTPQARHPPYEFHVTFPPRGKRPAKETSVLLQDSSGEDLLTSDYRTNRAASILWSDAILFVYNPDHAAGKGGGGRGSQSHLLNGIRQDLEQRLRGTSRALPPLVVACSKADVVPDLAAREVRARIGDEPAIRNALRALGDGAVVDAVDQWRGRTFMRFVAPQPKDGTRKQQGVVELFNLLLAQLTG